MGIVYLTNVLIVVVFGRKSDGNVNDSVLGKDSLLW